MVMVAGLNNISYMCMKIVYAALLLQTELQR